MELTGRQTQFYVDIIYGVIFAAGFSVLLFGGMDPRIAAFQGGLILGYFLRVWENMSVYERILREEVAEEAEEAVADEAAAKVAAEAHDEVAAELDEQVEPEVTAEVERQVAEEMAAEIKDRVTEEVTRQIDERIEQRLAALEGDDVPEGSR